MKALRIVPFALIAVVGCADKTPSTHATGKVLGHCWTDLDDSVGGKTCFSSPGSSGEGSYEQHAPWSNGAILKGKYVYAGVSITIDARYTEASKMMGDMTGESQPSRWEILEYIGSDQVKIHYFNTHPNPEYQSDRIKIMKRMD